ncbi:MAG: chemotaxis-specific protein-glutamate methyltransferase CheB [Magnetococcales bacterium]|nr:chemotaxis-specific protein-glutamate methyltransferase CheB [Magnetococcales bacterium]
MGVIRVLLVDDSIIALTVLRKMFDSANDVEIVGTAKDGVEALELIPKVSPNVICTDLHMPRMDGLQLTKEVMQRHPLPILVVSVSVQDGDDDNIFRLLEAGAIDVFPKPRGGLDGNLDPFRTRELLSKVRILSGVVPIRRHRRVTAGSGSSPQVVVRSGVSRPKLITIGASTGGPQAIMEILSDLPGDLAVPVVCIQHISSGFLNEMVEWLNRHTPLKVTVAREGEAPKAGWVYFPPEDCHLTFDDQGRFITRHEEQQDFFLESAPWHCPSVDVTFMSALKAYGKDILALLLTGMGKDGAEGMMAMTRSGCITVAQDEESCVVFGMPQQAIAMGGARHVLSLARMADFIRQNV